MRHCVRWVLSNPQPKHALANRCVFSVILCCRLANRNEKLCGVATAILPLTQTHWCLYVYCVGVQRYELDSPAPSAGKFSLDVGEKLDGSAEVKLRLNERVDRETQAEYRLRLRAVDGGTPTSRTGTLDIVVAVLDSNDNRPAFTEDQYELTVVEKSPVGRVKYAASHQM